MNELKPILDLLGVDFETALSLAAMVLVIIGFLKAQIPGLKGIYTTAAALVISLGLSFKVHYVAAGPTDWWALITTALVCWIGPAGFNNVVENLRGVPTSKAFKK